MVSLHRSTSKRIQDILSLPMARRHSRPAPGLYTRYSNKWQQSDKSIEDQLRECTRLAGVEFAPSLHFHDRGVSGAEPGREDLANMLDAASRGEISDLYIYSMSRLARDCVMTISLLRWLVYVCRVRVRSVAERIDTDSPNWEISTTLLAVFAEQMLKEAAITIHRGLEGTVLAGYSVGDYCFGYQSIADPSGATRRLRGEIVPRKVYAIHEVNANWVRLIFRLFVKEGRSLSWIAKELNRLGAPRDHRSKTKRWTDDAVRYVLRNPKYIGIWPWGRSKNVRNPVTGMKSRERRSDGEISEWTREFPNLMIIDNHTFHTALLKLRSNSDAMAQFRDADGRLGAAAGPYGVPRHLLQVLLRCHVCGSKYYVCGKGARYLRCSGHNDGECSQGSYLPRQLAEKRILEEIGNHLLSNGVWTTRVLDYTRKIWRRAREGVPDNVQELTRRLNETKGKLSRLVTRMEDAEEKFPIVWERIRELDEQRCDLEDELARQQIRLGQLPQEEPNEDWLRERLTDLCRVLRSQTPAASTALGDLLQGFISVTEIDDITRVRKNFCLTMTLKAAAIGAISPYQMTPGPDEVEALLIPLSFEIERPTVAREQLVKTWELINEGKRDREIAECLGVSPSRMTAIMKELARNNPEGMSVFDLHQRAKERRAQTPTMAVRLMADVARLFAQPMLVEDIAEELSCSRPIATKAIKLWHEQQGIPMPDLRSRRKDLPVKTNRSRRRPPPSGQ